MGFHDCGDGVSGEVGMQVCGGSKAHSGLAGALDDIAGLDNAVEDEAAILAHRRHDARSDAIKARVGGGRVQLHAS